MAPKPYRVLDELGSHAMDNHHPNCASRVREFFGGAGGKRHYIEVLGIAERMIRTKHWCVATHDRSAPGGKTAVDLVGKVVESLLSGKSSFGDDIAVEPALYQLMRRAINRLATSYENTHRDDSVGTNDEGARIDRLESATPFWDPTNENLSPEELQIAGARCTRFIEFCRKDKNLVAMLLLIRDTGMDQDAKKIGAALNVSVMEVYNIRKRLGNAVRRFERKENE